MPMPNPATTPIITIPSATVQIDPALLTIHPDLKDLPQWSDDDPQFEALFRDIESRGIDYPLKINSRKQICDGRHRWRGARRVKLPLVPCDVVPDDQVHFVIIQSIAQRRHYTKSALAYMLAPVLRSQSSTQAQFEQLGNASNLGLTLLKYAEQLRVIFRTEKQGEDYRQVIEPQILSGDCGLGPAVAGYAGFVATIGISKKVRGELDLWSRSFANLKLRFNAWDKFDSSAKSKLYTDCLNPLVETMPLELLHKLQARCNAEAKARKESN